MDGQKCEKCGTNRTGGTFTIISFFKEFPGMYIRYGTDISRNGVGIPLCYNCLGTGIEAAGNKKFNNLKERVKKIIKEIDRVHTWFVESCNILHQKYPKKLEIITSLYKSVTMELNMEIIEISQKALEIIKKPAKGCLALKLKNLENQKREGGEKIKLDDLLTIAISCQQDIGDNKKD